MFEKSLYDLIRGLRNHRGNEREYIQASIRECRNEIRSTDMDLKATAVLKLTYLEMFGHDMSWASFNILETMSSQKYLQKRVGYLGAVQSFRPDTEVLMLAENLLKKDLAHTQLTNISLPLMAIPHVVNPSMANSLLSDLLSRLTHSSPYIRKKTVATLYRLALVYPETLRAAWPRIKERLQDENEDPSVTSAVVNVVCELGWRRPQDFLPIAPRLFDLLVAGSNNWMAIKIVKLFAILTPLEPRLVNKLLPPLTQLIRTTPAMSLLYECINGIIQGGVLEAAQGTTKGDEIARLCVGKLRGMLLIENDPNLKYVALLAFNRIVDMHPYLVTTHEEVVIQCIDDLDVSIRLRALDLIVGMVNPQNLVPIVDRLMSQLRSAPFESSADDPVNDRGSHAGVVPQAMDEDDDEVEEPLPRHEKTRNDAVPLPDDYRNNVIRKVLSMCSQETYASVNDFDWYIDVLTQLVRCVPSTSDSSSAGNGVAHEIGNELRSVAVRVKSSREEAARAAEVLVSVDKRAQYFPPAGNGGIDVLEPSVWIAGEFAHLLLDPRACLDSLMHASSLQLPGTILSAYLQALAKIYSHVVGDDRIPWTPERRTMTSLLTAKVSHFLEQLTTHPNIEVQERAVEYLELTRLASEALSGQANQFEDEYEQHPLLLTQAIPALFAGMELNPIAKDAQSKVAAPEGLDLDAPINDNLTSLLQVPDYDTSLGVDDEFYTYYYERPKPTSTVPETAAKRLEVHEPESFSYQQANGSELDSALLAQRRAARREQYRDDPFFIPSSEEQSGRITPSIPRTANDDLDVDSIPIMELHLGGADAAATQRPGISSPSKSSSRNVKKRHEILADETFDDPSISASASSPLPSNPLPPSRSQRSLLGVDSSGLGAFSLTDQARANKLAAEEKEAEEAEMEAAMREVERLRLEMQREAERIEGPPGEATVVKRKKKKKKPPTVPTAEDKVAGVAEGKADGERSTTPKKKKAVQAASEDAGEKQEDEPSAEQPEAEAAPKPKKKKKRRQITFDEDDANGIGT